MDLERLLVTLEGSGTSPCLCGILETFWNLQQVVPIYNGFHGPAFPSKRGTTQGGLVSPTLLNVLGDNVIIIWLPMTVEDQRVAHDGLGETVERCLGVFYSEDDMVGSRGADWMQHSMNVLVGLFRIYGLAANVANSRTMTCQPGALRSGMSDEAKALKCTGVGYSYWVRLRRQIPCPEFGVDLTVGSMTSHRRHMHEMEPAIDWSQLPVSHTNHQPQV